MRTAGQGAGSRPAGPCRPARARRAGFTLLELLVVLTLVAAVVGLGAPRALAVIDGARLRGAASALQATLTALPLRAAQAQQPLALDADALRAEVADLPPTWRIELQPDRLRYGPFGHAEGGAVTLHSARGQRQAWRIAPVSGLVSAAAAGP